jgi:CBS domain containing-hemolysin-like protein
LFVTFLHLVIGEMAPKSWAIAHPELAANIIGIPARGMAWMLRPLLIWINRIANRLVAASGYEPTESRALGGQDMDTIRQLVEHSAAAGTLDDSLRAQLAHVFDLERLRIGDLIADGPWRPTSVAQNACVADVRAAAAKTGHLRILVDRAGATPGLVHVRDLMLASDDQGIQDFTRAAFTLDVAMPAYEALTHMREAGEQFAVVKRNDGFVGAVTMADILRRVLPHGVNAGL